MNVASLFDRLVGRYMIVALSFSPFPKIGPIPTPATRGSSGLFSMRRVAPQSAQECQLPPPAVETPRELSASAKGFFRRRRRRFTALRLISFRKHRRMHDSNRTAAHGPVKVSRFLPGVWRLVPDSAVPSYFPNHLRDPFCRQQPACCPAIGKSRGFHSRKWSLTRPGAASVPDAQSKPAPA